MDLAEGHVAALNFLSQNTGWHAINLGTGKAYSVLEMVRAFESASSRKVPYQVVTRRPGDVAACYANPTRAGELLNWTAQRSLEDMCASTWQFQQSINLRAASLTPTPKPSPSFCLVLAIGFCGPRVPESRNNSVARAEKRVLFSGLLTDY